MIPDDGAVPSTSKEGLSPPRITGIEDDDDSSTRNMSLRNHSLKVEVEGSPRSSHHRSFSDAGRRRERPTVEVRFLIFISYIKKIFYKSVSVEHLKALLTFQCFKIPLVPRIFPVWHRQLVMQQFM